MPTTKSAHLLLGVTVPNADALGAPFRNDFTKPDIYGIDNCIGAYVFSGSQERSLINYADTTKPLTIIGKPTFDMRGATVSRGNCFNTGLLPTTGMTLAVLLENNTTLIQYGGAIISCLTPAADAGTAFQRGDQLAVGVAGDGAVAYFSDRGGSTQIYGLAAGLIMPPSTPAAIAISVDANNLADGTIGKGGTNTNVTQRAGTGTNTRTLWTNPFLIGSNYDFGNATTQYSGKMRVKAVAIYNRAYSSSEINSIINSLRTWAATVGYTI